MKGIAYQQGISNKGETGSDDDFSDPLADKAKCQRDVAKLKDLGANIIRTYAIDPKKDHKDCMQMLNDAGIYVISDLGQPKQSINRNEPSWDTDLFARYQAVVDNLGQYSNVVGFFAGNEVSNSLNTTGASAYVKAAVRDTKKYIKDKKLGKGVGYAADDDAKVRDYVIPYFNCGSQEDAIDFFGYNVYEWCGDSSFQKSGYNRILDEFKDYSVPSFFAEYGCNNQGGAAKRIFTETPALYVKNMSSVFSGGIVYEYFQEENDYGLVKESGDSVTELADYKTLKTQMAKADPEGVEMSSYNPSNKPQSCPKVDGKWLSSEDLPPTPNQDACGCMSDAASCAVKDSTDVKDYGKMFNYICGNDKKACEGINGNSTTGEYGTWSMCSSKQKLNIVLDAYYKGQNKASDACSFDGKAATQSASKKSSDCKKIADAGGRGSDSGDSAPGGSGDDSDSGASVWGVSLAGLIGAAVLAL